MTRSLAVSALLLVCAGLYFYGLNAPDAYLSIEEVQHGRQALALATTGRDVMGTSLPMYFAQPDFLPGRDPLWIYVSAAALSVLPFSEGLLRAPSALAGVANVVLMFLIARRLFHSSMLGYTAAALLALSPSHFMQSRIATSQIVPVLFVLLWLYFLIRYVESHSGRDLAIAAGCLGLGLYAYLPSIVTMPALFATSLVILHRSANGDDERDVRLRHLVQSSLVFMATLTPILIWHALHPERFALLREYYSANGYNRSPTALLSLPGLLNRADLLWNAFNPGALFFSGDANLRFSTRTAGHLPVAAMILIVIASLRALGDAPRYARHLIVTGMVIAAAPAVIAGDYEIKRWLIAIPFLILACVAGAAAVVRSPRRASIPVFAILLAAGAIQFTSFLRDYHGAYRARSAAWFGGNMKGAILEVLREASDPRCVFIDKRVYPDYWPLYAAAGKRDTFAAVTNVVDVAEGGFAVPDSCVEGHAIVPVEFIRENGRARDALRSPQWTGQAVPERAPGAEPYLIVYRYHRQ